MNVNRSKILMGVSAAPSVLFAGMPAIAIGAPMTRWRIQTLRGAGARHAEFRRLP